MSEPSREGPPAAAGLRPGVRVGVASAARARDPRNALRRLASWLGPERGAVAVVGACVVAYTLLGLVGPYLLGVALDRDVAGRDAAGLARTAGLMIAAHVSAAALDALANRWMAGIAQRALARLRGALFAHLQRLPMAYFDRHPSGELTSRVTNDVDAIQQAVAQNLTAFLASLLSMVGILVAMFALEPRLALASLLVVPAMLWFTRTIAVRTRRGFTALQEDLGALNATMTETLEGQRVVAAFGREEAALAAFVADNERVYRAGVAANTAALLLMPLTAVLGNLLVIVLVAAGGWLALEGITTVGVIASFVHYGQSFVAPLRQISLLYNTLQAALAGSERVFEILDTPPEEDGGAAPLDRPVRGHVRFEHVTFGYRPDVPVLRDVSIEALPGRTVALVGPTGAGKTTVAQLLTRLYEIDGGTITLDGRDVRDVPKDELRRAVGLVLQDTFLFATSVMENLRQGRPDATDDEVRAAARLAEAEPFILQLPQGYDTVLSERGADLSRGQRQLLSIARTLLADPPVLVLDEATSSVDTRTEARIQRALSRLSAGRTTFVIAHRLATIRDADLVVVIDGGRVVEEGSHEALLARDGLYRRLHESQFRGHAI